MSSGKKALVRAGPARVTDAGPASWAIGAAHKAKEALRVLHGTEAIPGGETHVCQASEGGRKIARSVLKFNRVRLTSHVLQQEKKTLRACRTSSRRDTSMLS